MIDDVRILDGSSFVLSGRNGDIYPVVASPNGLIVADTRFLSRWVLTINGQRLIPLSVDNPTYFEARFFLITGGIRQYDDPTLSVTRHRRLCGAIYETLSVVNHCDSPVQAQIRIDIGADFASLIEVREAQPKVGQVFHYIGDDHLCLEYRRGCFRRQTVIRSSAPAQIDEDGFSYTVEILPNQQWKTRIEVVPQVITVGGIDIRPSLTGGCRTSGQMHADLDVELREAPRIDSTSEALTQTYRQSLVDLHALRFCPLAGDRVPAAGLPWYMAIRGRDSILASLQALPFIPTLAQHTLRLLGAIQGSRFDDFRDEDPGRIIAEVRYGEKAAFNEHPTPYYGAADATPLYLILLDEYERWTGDHDLVRSFEPEARAAMAWIDEHANLMGDGYIWYEPRRPETGLANQSWKSSPDAIAYRDGRIPGFPRTTCELQGYVYDAKLRTARLARLVWQEPDWADQLEREADALKERFNRDFWMADEECYALGLDSDGGQIDALASNMGHLLWSGIVPPDRARKVVDRLASPEFFSGWGIRSLATGQARYNPLGYGVGTVWPFDNALIAWGMRRYGFDRQAALVAQSIIDAASFFAGRLPEAFGGFDREETRYPVEYPAACMPHATSAGAPLMLIRVLLGLEAEKEHLAIRPALPTTMGRIEVLDIPGQWGRVDVFARGRIDIDTH